MSAEVGFEQRKGLKRSLDWHEIERLQGDGSADRISGSRCGDGSFGG